MAGPLRAGARGSGRHAPAGVSWGRASGWAGRDGFVSVAGGLGAGRDSRSRRRAGAAKALGTPARWWQWEASGPGACVRDLRDGVNVLLLLPAGVIPTLTLRAQSVRPPSRGDSDFKRGNTGQGELSAGETALGVFSAFP